MLNGGAIAGIVIACVLVVGIAVLIFVVISYQNVKKSIALNAIVSCTSNDNCLSSQVCSPGTNTCVQVCGTSGGGGVACPAGTSCQQGMCKPASLLLAVDTAGTLYSKNGAGEWGTYKLPFGIRDIILLQTSNSSSSNKTATAGTTGTTGTASATSTASSIVPAAIVVDMSGKLWALMSNASTVQLGVTIPFTSIVMTPPVAGVSYFVATTAPSSSGTTLASTTANAQDIYVFIGTVSALLSSTDANWKKITNAATSALPPSGIKYILVGRNPQGTSSVVTNFLAIAQDNTLWQSNNLNAWLLATDQTIITQSKFDAQQSPSLQNAQQPYFAMNALAYNTNENIYYVLQTNNTLCTTTASIGTSSLTGGAFNCVSASNVPSTSLQILRYY